MNLNIIQAAYYTVVLPFGLSAFFVYLVIVFSYKHNLYDATGGRKIHSGSIPRLGGFGFTAAAVFTLLILYARFGISIFSDTRYLYVTTGACIIFIMGLLDDLKNWPAGLKFMLQFIAACLTVYAGFRFTRITFAPIGMFWNLGIISYPLTILWILGITNAVNLMDGIDGQVACLSGSILITYAVLFCINGVSVSIIYFCIIAASVLGGFLLFNLARPSAKIFMGDCGSQLLGFILAVLPIMTHINGNEVISLPFAASFLMLPIFDVFAAIWRRVRDHKPVREGDKFHLHHKLMLIGFSPRGTLACVMIIQIIIDLFTAQAVVLRGMMALTTLIGLLLVCSLFFIMTHFEKERVIHIPVAPCTNSDSMQKTKE